MLFLIVQMLGAQSAAENTNIETSRQLVLQLSTLPEAKLGFTQNFIFPFLQGGSPLTEGNNINLGLTAEVTPISIVGRVSTVWTPIAFFQLSAGGRIGSGWTIELLGSDVYGIGINRPNAQGNSEFSGGGFDGLQWNLYTGGTIQFDFAALFPGDWNHVVALTYHEINYKGYTGAKAGESWYYENDAGENINGFNYYGNFLVGYQMPIFLSMAALLAEMDLYLYDTPNRSQWGDDRIRMFFSAVLNFTVHRQFDITMITQFRTMRNYLEDNWKDLYYRNRTLDTSNPLRLEFYRVAAVLTYKF